MGCVYSNSSENHPRIFQVMNVDDRGLHRNPGKIEITDTELILHRRGDEPVRWPLRCLRRYGFDSELFSFESGRRCPTGQGIYAFKCMRAEALFNLLQECVARAGQDDQQIAGATERITPTPGVEGQMNGSVQLSAAVPPYSAQSPGESQVHYINGDIIPESNQSTSQLSNIVPNGGPDVHEYMNTHMVPTTGPVAATDPAAVDLAVAQGQTVQENGRVIKYAVLNLPNLPSLRGQGITRGRLPSIQTDGSEGSPIVHVDPNSSQAMYVNVCGDVRKDTPLRHQNSDVFLTDQTATTSSSVQAALPTLDLPPAETDPAPYLNVKLAPGSSHAKQGYRDKWRGGTITYVQLDLKSDDKANGNNVPASPISVASSANLDSPSRRTESYAKIDFDKTRALQNSTTQAHDEEGSRKTRHNSNIDDLS